MQPISSTRITYLENMVDLIGSSKAIYTKSHPLFPFDHFHNAYEKLYFDVRSKSYE